MAVSTTGFMIVTPCFSGVKTPVRKELDTNFDADFDANRAAISVLSSMPSFVKI
jgi:hypothetical protein